MSEYSVVGKRLPRIDALGKVTGSAVYSADITLPGMLYAKVLRSPYPHAVIRRIDVSKAKKLKGVITVITAEDIPGYGKKGSFLPELPYMAMEKVVYAEQPVAVLAAVDVQVAEKAIELIEVEYEQLPYTLDTLESMQEGARLIHPNLYANITINNKTIKDDKPGNIANDLHIERGDPEKGFDQADIVLENTYKTPPIHHGFIEPFAALARPDPNGNVTIWSQSQGIFLARHKIAEFLNLPLGKVILEQVEIGGAFGGKTYLPAAPFCALLAVKTGLPVKMEMSRDEVIKDSRPAADSNITVKIGITNKGCITAASVSAIYNAGAFPEMSHAFFAGINAFSQYKIGNVRIDARDVITNRVPSSFYRAPGATQVHLAIESQIDLIAKALNMDPLQLRIQNVAREGDIRPNGNIMPRVGFRETLEKMAEYLSQKNQFQGENRGRGIACGFWNGGIGTHGAYVHVNEDASVNIVLGITDISGSLTSIAQIAAEELSLPFDKIKVVTGNTDTAPWATISAGSRTVYYASIAVYKACRDVKAQLISRAADKLGVDPSEIDFTRGLLQVKDDPNKSVSFAELAASAVAMGGPGPVVGSGSSGEISPEPTLSVHCTDVEVDRETGKVKILSYAVAQDVGLAVNPVSLEGQIQGAVVQGIGWALMENYVFDKGRVQNASLLDYLMPTAADAPMVDTMLVEVKSSNGVYGLRHAGEPPMIPALGAISNAVHDATGIRFTEMPMNPETILTGIRKQKNP